MNELATLTPVQLAEKIIKNRMMFRTVAVTEAEKVYLNGQYTQIIAEFDRRELLHESTLALMRDVF